MRSKVSIPEPNPSGLCMCGCGRRTPLARQTAPGRGLIKGKPVRYIEGHSSRKQGPEYLEEDRGYETPCWVWTRALSKGYGQKWVDGRTVKAHTWSYERAYGPVPDGLVLDHLCRQRDCVNPDHLEPVTQGENMRRAMTPTMIAFRTGICVRGHPYTPESAYYRADGSKQCRVCERIARARRHGKEFRPTPDAEERIARALWASIESADASAEARLDLARHAVRYIVSAIFDSPDPTD